MVTITHRPGWSDFSLPNRHKPRRTSPLSSEVESHSASSPHDQLLDPGEPDKTTCRGSKTTPREQTSTATPGTNAYLAPEKESVCLAFPFKAIPLALFHGREQAEYADPMCLEFPADAVPTIRPSVGGWQIQFSYSNNGDAVGPLRAEDRLDAPKKELYRQFTNLKYTGAATGAASVAARSIVGKNWSPYARVSPRRRATSASWWQNPVTDPTGTAQSKGDLPAVADHSIRRAQQYPASPFPSVASAAPKLSANSTLWQHSVLHPQQPKMVPMVDSEAGLPGSEETGRTQSSLQSAVVTNAVPSIATSAVLQASAQMPAGTRKVSGLDFDKYGGKDLTVLDLVEGMRSTGFQASSVADATTIINNMRTWRDAETGASTTIFLGYTSNLVSSGLRDIIRWLVQNKHVSAIVTTAGGVEEDLIKCLAPTYMGSFSLDGATLRDRGMNRIGNLVVPNENYCKFEDWVMPILDTMFEEQEASKSKDEPLVWTPSSVIERLGKEIDDPSSIYWWAWKNQIPVFCPALTDGSLGDMLFFHTFKTSPGVLDISITRDIRRINSLAMNAKRAGMIILGGGVVKHHIANACLMRNGAESAVYINTAQEFDGSDAGARPDEAVSWGKIKRDAESVKVYADATIVFPLIVAATFARSRSAKAKAEVETHSTDHDQAGAS